MITSLIRVWRWWYQRNWCVGLTIFAIALIPRAIPSGMFMDPDSSVFWIERTRGFLEALRGGDPALFAPALHPGVTLMWLTSLGLGAWHLIEPLVRQDPVMAFAWVLKLPIAVVTSILALTSWIYLRSFLGRALAVTIACIFALDPLYLVYSRYLHLDGLLAGFIMAGLLAAWSGTVRRRQRDVAVGALLLGLAGLTRLNGLIALVAAVAVIFLAGKSARVKWRWGAMGVFAAACVATVLVMWPAVWLAPEALRRLVDSNFGLVLLPHEVAPNIDIVPWVRSLLYPIFILTREWPFIIVAAGIGAVVSWRTSTVSHLGRAMTIFIVVWYGTLLVQPKDLDRYAVPLVGPLAILAGLGLVTVWQRWRNRWLRWGIAAAIIVQMMLFYRLGPMFQIYQNGAVQILKSTPMRTSQALTPAWGEGIREAVNFLRREDGHFPIVASWYAGVVCFYGNLPDNNNYPLKPGGSFECPAGTRLLAEPKDAEYLILSRDQLHQRLYPKLLDDIAGLGWKPVRTFAFHGVPMVYVYRNLGGLRDQYTLTGQ